MAHGAPAAPGGAAGTPITRMASSSSKIHLDKAFFLFPISKQFRHVLASTKGESGEQHYYINDFFVFVSSKQVLMAYLEMWDFQGVQVAQDLMAYLATQVCLAKRWVLSVLWIVLSPIFVIKSHKIWVM